MKTTQNLGSPHGPVPRNRPVFRRSIGRGFLWQFASFGLLLLGAVIAACSKNTTLDPSWGLPCSIAFGILILTMGGYGALFRDKEVSHTIAAGLDSPNEADVQIYIGTLASERDDARKLAAQILTTFLGELSEETLLCIDSWYWGILCPNPNAAGNPDWKMSQFAKSREDDFNIAVISAVMKIERMQALPYIEGLMTRIDEKPHSARYWSALTQCYELLLASRESCEQSATLLRMSAAPKSFDTLLHPLSDTHDRETGAGKQLLRASREMEKEPFE